MKNKRKKVFIGILLLFTIYLVIWYMGNFRQYFHWKIQMYEKYDAWYVYEDEAFLSGDR